MAASARSAKCSRSTPSAERRMVDGHQVQCGVRGRADPSVDRRYGNRGLEDQFEGMTQARRIEFAHAAGLIRPQHRRFLSTLNGLRNQFAHRPKYIDATIATYVADLDEKRRQSFRDGLNAVGPDPAPALRTLAQDAPATMIMVSSIATLAGLHDLKNVHVEKLSGISTRPRPGTSSSLLSRASRMRAVSSWLIDSPNSRPTSVARLATRNRLRVGNDASPEPARVLCRRACVVQASQNRQQERARFIR